MDLLDNSWMLELIMKQVTLSFLIRARVKSVSFSFPRGRVLIPPMLAQLAHSSEGFVTNRANVRPFSSVRVHVIHQVPP